MEKLLLIRTSDIQTLHVSAPETEEPGFGKDERLGVPVTTVPCKAPPGHIQSILLKTGARVIMFEDNPEGVKMMASTVRRLAGKEALPETYKPNTTKQ